MKKLNRNEAIEIAGLALVERVENRGCEATSRVIYPEFEPDHVGMQEFASSIKNENGTLTAYYFQRDEDLEGCEDLGNLDWAIEYYEFV